MTQESTKAPSARQLRVGEEMRHILAGLFQKGDFRDPAIHELNMTVTEVRVSPDLKNATAYVMLLGWEGTDAAVKALNHAAPYFRSQVAKALNLRHAPAIKFATDSSLEQAQRITDLLNNPKVSRDLGKTTPSEEE